MTSFGDRNNYFAFAELPVSFSSAASATLGCRRSAAVGSAEFSFRLINIRVEKNQYQ